ncbi:cytochrome P450 [Chytriomyces sp. MP71]|nr:cytochrome P450 [Chytriomyces sp. MP71]
MVREGMKEHGPSFALILATKRFYYLDSTAPEVQPIMDDFWKKTDFRASVRRVLDLDLFMPDAEITSKQAYAVHMLRTSFNASLGEVSETVARVMRTHVEATIAASPILQDPKDFAYTLVAHSSATCFLGPDVAAIPEVIDIFKSLFVTFQQPSLLRLILPDWTMKYLRPFLPFKRHHQRLARLVGPTLMKRVDNPDVGQEDGISHILKKTTNIDELTNVIMVLVLASMITTAGALHNTLYDLADHPECVDKIRAEMKESELEEGELFTRKQFGKMPFLDAFVRESLIHSMPVGLPGRYIAEPFRVSSTTVIPKDSVCFVIGVDAHPLDKNPDGSNVFNPSRWLPTSESEQQKYSTTTGPDFIVFGGGPYKCPGRFFAVLEIKSVICSILQKYNIFLSQ